MTAPQGQDEYTGAVDTGRMGTMTSERGWFADVDPEAEAAGDHKWQPCLETGAGHVPCFDMWFATEAECVEWIRENVVGVGLL